MNWKLGNYYRTRSGDKVKLVWIFRNGDLLTMREKDEQYVRLFPDGYYYPDGGSRPPTSSNLVAEWREPARVMVRMFRSPHSGRVRVWDEISLSGIPETKDLEEIARKEIIEGEGMA